jgi:hypothetical protein
MEKNMQTRETVELECGKLIPEIPDSLKNRPLVKGRAPTIALQRFIEIRDECIVLLREEHALTYAQISELFMRRKYLLTPAAAAQVLTHHRAKQNCKESLVQRYSKKAHTDAEFELLQNEVIDLRMKVDGMTTENQEILDLKAQVKYLNEKLNMMREVLEM